MIGKSTYIRNFTERQHNLLKKISLEKGLNTVPDILFYCLEEYFSSSEKIRLLENNKIKLQNKIEIKENEINDIKTIFERVLYEEHRISKSEVVIQESKTALIEKFNLKGSAIKVFHG